MDKTELLQHFIQKVWIEGDTAVAAEMFADSGSADGVIPSMTMTGTDFSDMAAAFLEMVQNPTCEILTTVEQGDWLSALVKVSALNAANMDPIEITGQIMLHYADGRVLAAHNHFDYIALFEQMGLLPQDALVMFLSGAKVA